ncbi:hypothetical protein KKH36_02425 [Patescibacteria group bacterium]|nr:hypothetical protein [Patescibacteria group bacterium]
MGKIFKSFFYNYIIAIRKNEEFRSMYLSFENVNDLYESMNKDEHPLVEEALSLLDHWNANKFKKEVTEFFLGIDKIYKELFTPETEKKYLQMMLDILSLPKNGIGKIETQRKVIIDNFGSVDGFIDFQNIYLSLLKKIEILKKDLPQERTRKNNELHYFIDNLISGSLHLPDKEKVEVFILGIKELQ